MAGEKFVLSGMTDTSIEEVADYLTIEYDQFHLRLHYIDPDDTGSIFEVVYRADAVFNREQHFAPDARRPATLKSGVC